MASRVRTVRRVTATVKSISVESYPLGQLIRATLLKFKRFGWNRSGVVYIADARVVSEDEFERLMDLNTTDNELRILAGYAKSQYGDTDAKFCFRLALDLE